MQEPSPGERLAGTRPTQAGASSLHRPCLPKFDSPGHAYPQPQPPRRLVGEAATQSRQHAAKGAESHAIKEPGRAQLTRSSGQASLKPFQQFELLIW